MALQCYVVPRVSGDGNFLFALTFQQSCEYNLFQGALWLDTLKRIAEQLVRCFGGIRQIQEPYRSFQRTDLIRRVSRLVHNNYQLVKHVNKRFLILG